MKKLLSVSIAALAFAAVADPDPVYSPITVGVTEIATTTTQTDYIIPVPYQTIGSNTAVSVHDLVKAANLPTGTKLYHYNGTSYQVWEVSGGTWTPPSVVTTPAIAGTSLAAGSSDVTIAVGSALWVVFGTGYPEADQKIYVYGSPVATKTTTISETGKTYLLSNPTDTTISDLATKLGSIAGKGDKIFPIGGGFSGYYAYNGSTWKKVEGTKTTEASLPALGAYAGFWYVNKSAGSGTSITW
jgi:hypothetical protein